VGTLVFSCQISGLRLDKAVFNGVANYSEHKYSRNEIQSLIETGRVRKNGSVVTSNSNRLRKDDEISVDMVDFQEPPLEAKAMELNIVYEDSDLMVLDKQSGLTVHPGAGNSSNTLVNALMYHCGDNLSDLGGKFRPGIVHRLDKDTSGLMVVAKNNFAHSSLKEQLESRELKRIYNALVYGTMVPKNGEIAGYMARHRHNRLKMVLAKDGRYSSTSYRTLVEFGTIASLVECVLSTGRTHQIRVHFSSIKHPLVGDRLYGGYHRKILGQDSPQKKFIEEFPRQALHSRRLNFRHPRTGVSLFFEVPLPIDLENLVKVFEKLN
jgi:23S rRNA pseudouridine1911/1915/1917 synthase